MLSSFVSRWGPASESPHASSSSTPELGGQACCIWLADQRAASAAVADENVDATEHCPDHRERNRDERFSLAVATADHAQAEDRPEHDQVGQQPQRGDDQVLEPVEVWPRGE